MSKDPEPPITLVVRRGALRRFDKLQKETAHLPVVVAWDRRTGEQPAPEAGDEPGPVAEDRRRQASFTWDLADFVIVPGEGADGLPQADVPDEDTSEKKASGGR